MLFIGYLLFVVRFSLIDAWLFVVQCALCVVCCVLIDFCWLFVVDCFVLFVA